MMHLAAAILLTLAQNNDKAQANGYDDAWKQAWKDQCRTVLLGGSGKTDGFVLHIGDSITYSGAYGAWIGGGTNRTTEDLAINTWINNFSVPGGIDATSQNGLYLAHKDIPPPPPPAPQNSYRAMTAAGGIATDEFISGNGNGGPVMPGTMNVGNAQSNVANSTYTANLNIQSVAYAFSAAQIAVVMLGTNDCSGGRAASAFIADLQSIVTTLEGNHIAVVLSTIPPHPGNNTLAQQYNTEIRNYASSHKLPLIDFYAEIIARVGTGWSGTLINPGSDVHPSGDRAGYTITSDVYANGGNATTHKTGQAAAEVGYLLRSWLTAQKLKEVRSFVVQNNPVVLANPSPGPGPGPGPGPSPSPSPAPSAPKSNGGDGGKCGGSVGGPVSPWTLAGTALAALALLAVTRKTGF